MSDGHTYEMLWDCKFCGARKLLGKTHRHCPNCGAPQDHTARYYPADHEKVAVQDHQFVGADLRCTSCGEASSAAAKHCGNCGSPLEGAQTVAMRSDRVQAEALPLGALAAGAAKPGPTSTERAGAGASAPSKRGSGPLIGCISVAIAALLVVGMLLFWKKPTMLEVAGHRWLRTIEVEHLQTVHGHAWCNELPREARVLSREKRERSMKQVPNGEDCSVRKEDRGDGTFAEVRECKPKYRNEPVFDQHCRFDIDSWTLQRTEKASGSSLAQAPVWPDAKPAREGHCLGCERLGQREATYTVQLRDKGTGGTEECNLVEAAWRGLSLGQQVKAETRRLGGGLDCSSLAPVK